MAQTRRRSGGLVGRIRNLAGGGGGDRPAGAQPTENLAAATPAQQRNPLTQERSDPDPEPGTTAASTSQQTETASPTDPLPAEPADAEAGPDGPTDIPAHGWVATLKRAGKGFKQDGLQDWAAALTYYSVLSLFPLLIVFVALIGVFGEYPRTVNAMLDIVRDLAPGSTADTVESSISGVVRDKGGAGALLGVGLLTALWSASGYIGAFMRAANAVYATEETRPFWKLRPLQLLVTAVMVIMLGLLAIGFVLSGSVAHTLGDTIGLGDSTVTVWSIAKWPVMLLIAIFMVALLTWVGPDVDQAKFRWITPGAATGLLILLIASVAFAFYAANFASYNATYGTLGGVIVFLIWLWIANLALLFGVELDAELERQRRIEARTVS